MPSIGAATELIVARRIDEGMMVVFDNEKSRQDAYRFLNLSSRGGDETYIVLAAVFGMLLVAFAIVSGWTIVSVVAAVISFFGIRWAVRRRDKARRELDALMTSGDREYWLSVAEKVKRIVLKAGKFEDGISG